MWPSIKRKISSTSPIENVSFLFVRVVCYLSFVLYSMCPSCVNCVCHVSVPYLRYLLLSQRVHCYIQCDHSLLSDFSCLMFCFTNFHVASFVILVYLSWMFYSFLHTMTIALQEANCDKAGYYVATTMLDWQTMPGIRSTMDIISHQL